ncbi:MAG: ATP synthase F0 subunit B [Bacteroidetes bacterium]|nr:MAG: ATP synthase F0 subunit B [Bacteroidota bacterium]
MFYLLDFNPILPDVGLLFWSTITFLLFWLIVGKFAFRPIAGALSQREHDIQDALDLAKQAREEMAALKSDNDRIIGEAREEQARILKEAKESGNKIIAESKDKARDEAHKIVTNARLEIDSQAKHAITEVKNQVGKMALDIAEQVLRKELSSDKAQQDYVDLLVKEIKLN